MFQDLLTVCSRIDKTVGTKFRHSSKLYIHSRDRVFSKQNMTSHGNFYKLLALLWIELTASENVWVFANLLFFLSLPIFRGNVSPPSRSGWTETSVRDLRHCRTSRCNGNFIATRCLRAEITEFFLEKENFHSIPYSGKNYLRASLCYALLCFHYNRNDCFRSNSSNTV